MTRRPRSRKPPRRAPDPEMPIVRLTALVTVEVPPISDAKNRGRRLVGRVIVFDLSYPVRYQLGFESEPFATSLVFLHFLLPDRLDPPQRILNVLGSFPSAGLGAPDLSSWPCGTARRLRASSMRITLMAGWNSSTTMPRASFTHPAAVVSREGFCLVAALASERRPEIRTNQ